MFINTCDESGIIDKTKVDYIRYAREFFEYYRTPRGDHVDAISPRPILFVAGANAHSLYFTQQAFERAAEPKELHIVPGAGHVDLYDRVELIPFDKLQSFFEERLV